MIKQFLIIGLLLWVMPAWAEVLVLSEPDLRITDKIVNDDLQKLHDVQRRLDKVDIQAVQFGRYHKAKAQALLDFAWDEYHENDRTGAVEASFSYAQALISALKEGKTDISMETRLLPGTRIVEQADADTIAAMKKDKHFHCAQEPIATREVILLWMGHEYDELGWRHTRNQQKQSDALDKQAKELMAKCNAPQVVPAQPELPCIPASRMCEQAAPPSFISPIIKRPAIPTHRTIVYFDLDKHNLQATGPGTLNAALQFIQQYPDAYRIRIEAHTDRLASTAYNEKLSKQRAKKVRNYMAKHGVNGDIIEIDWFGETRPVVFCADKDYRSHKALAACLQKNRRAEVFIYTVDSQ